MSRLTRENALEHCRICLELLIKPEYLDVRENEHDGKLNLETNQDLQDFIELNVHKEFSTEDLKHCKEFPSKICLSCYDNFQVVENFRKQAVESVRHLLIIFQLDPVNIGGLNKNNGDALDNIYNILMKDSLMETESILLSSSIIDTNQNSHSADPDPFDESTVELTSEQDSLIKEEAYDRATMKNLESIEWANNDSNYSLSSNCDNDNNDQTDYSTLLTDCNDIPTAHTLNKSTNKHSMPAFKSSQQNKKLPKQSRRSKGSRNSFKCDQCNHSFAHKITLDAHIRKIHEGNKKPFQCDKCEKSYSFIGGLYTHIKEVHEVEVRSHACDHPGCDRVYTSIIAMQKHKRLKHYQTLELKSYCCELCGATFKQSGNLKYHMRNKHPTDEEKVEKEKEKEQYLCDICKKSFHSRYTLNYHKLQLHAGEMKYACDVCGRRMAKKFMLAQHMLVHSTDKMPCPHCPKQFIRKFELEAHIKAVHMKLKPFSCQYCGECFASRKTLRHHEYIHTGEKPYVCNICGQGYRQQTCLKNHRKLHFKNEQDSLEQKCSADNETIVNSNNFNENSARNTEKESKISADSD